MIRLQDIADMAGVSRTTVSNVMYGRTKKVSQKTIDRIKKILEEEEYIPNMGSHILTGRGSKIIGFVIGYAHAHGMDSIQDPYVSELLSVIEREAEECGYFVMLIGGEDYENVVDIASKWNVEGLIIIGYQEKKYRQLCKKLNKKMILLDTFPEGEYDFQNVGVDDDSGGYQVGKYLKECGFSKAVFVAETVIDTDYCRWRGFKRAMEEDGSFCSKSRYIIVDGRREPRLREYQELLPEFLEAGAIAFSSDYAAIEAMSFFYDNDIRVPDQISIVGQGDSIYAELVRPKLTTVKQDVEKKAVIAMNRLVRMIQGEELKEFNVKNPVRLIIRDSVRKKKE